MWVVVLIGFAYRSTFSSCFATGALQTLSASSIVFVVLFNIALYMFLTAACFFFSRPPIILSSGVSVTVRGKACHPFRQMSPQETIAVCFCGPAKSTALGIPLLYAMWGSLDLYIKSKTSVPVLLYTTEQICVAHFFVHMFKWWHRRVDRKSASKSDVECDGEGDLGGGEKMECSGSGADGLGLEDRGKGADVNLSQDHTRNHA